MRRRYLTPWAMALLLAGCGAGPTEPATPWYYGVWEARSIDGVTMPATIGTARYDDFSLIASADFASFNISERTAGGTSIGCLGYVTLTATGDAVRSFWRSDIVGGCGIVWFDHTFTRNGTNMTTQWEGHTVTLVKK